MQDLIRRLNSLCEFLDESFDINCGGCCLIARYIAEHLDELDIKYNLIIFDHDDRDEDEVIYEVQNNENVNEYNSVTGYCTCSHYCIEIEDELINCESKYEDKNYYKFRIPNITWSNIDWIYDNGDWNSIYDYKYSDTIEKIISNFFELYKNNIELIK